MVTSGGAGDGDGQRLGVFGYAGKELASPPLRFSFSIDDQCFACGGDAGGMLDVSRRFRSELFAASQNNMSMVI
jgi:hypothetical protein